MGAAQAEEGGVGAVEELGCGGAEVRDDSGGVGGIVRKKPGEGAEGVGWKINDIRYMYH